MDTVDYWWRYDIWFHVPGINCSLSGNAMKVYVHDDKGGLALNGEVYALNYTSDRDPDIYYYYLDEDGEQQPDIEILPRCDLYLSQYGDHRS